MASVVIGSKLFGEMFGAERMRNLFTDEYIVSRYLDVEAALARAQAKLGIIPSEAAKAITAAAQISRVDWKRLSERTQIVGYPILPLVEQLSGWAEDGLGQWCHWGATTQDIMDTADVLQARDALALVSEDLDTIASSLSKLAEAHADQPICGAHPPSARASHNVRIQGGDLAVRHRSAPDPVARTQSAHWNGFVLRRRRDSGVPR
jgi:3-carboxy-cis,cis-muconate cycloisomerase